MPAVMLRLIYWCRPDALWCHKCHKPLRAAMTQGSNYAIATCINKGNGMNCGERLLLLPPDTQKFGEPRTTIIRITKAEAAAVRCDQTANDVLRDINAFAQAATEQREAS